MSTAGTKKQRKTRNAVVIKNKMDKTVVVECVRRVAHPVYGKFMKRRIRLQAHDENNDCGVGDTVLIEETRPLSRSKRWKIRSIIKREELQE